MCGIVGCIGSKNIEKFLIKKLKLLEYRGYDSAGIATLLNNEIKVIKQSGNIEKLEKKIKEENHLYYMMVLHMLMVIFILGML